MRDEFQSGQQSEVEEEWWPPWRWNGLKWIWVSMFCFWLSWVTWCVTPGFHDWLGNC